MGRGRGSASLCGRDPERCARTGRYRAASLRGIRRARSPRRRGRVRACRTSTGVGRLLPSRRYRHPVYTRPLLLAPRFAAQSVHTAARFGSRHRLATGDSRGAGSRGGGSRDEERAPRSRPHRGDRGRRPKIPRDALLPQVTRLSSPAAARPTRDGRRPPSCGSSRPQAAARTGRQDERGRERPHPSR